MVLRIVHVLVFASSIVLPRSGHETDSDRMLYRTVRSLKCIFVVSSTYYSIHSYYMLIIKPIINIFIQGWPEPSIPAIHMASVDFNVFRILGISGP